VSFVTPDRTATLPAGLRGAAAAVLGLTTYNPNRTPHRVATRHDAYQPYGLATYGPHDFETMYNAPAATTGSGQTVAVITQGDLRGVATDLATFQSRNNLPSVPLTVVQTTATSTDTSGADEYDLDTQYSTGFAPGVSTLLAYNSDTLGDIHPLNAFVTENRAKTASASYGGCEILNALLGDVTADDQVFQQAQAQGQTFWFSSGDEGSACSILVNAGAPVGVPDVEYPASSPYVVAVGGTSLTGQTTQPTREITWLGGGGGYSNIESAPSWQADNLAFTGAVGRGVPDVSLDADPSSGYTVVVGGSDTTIGGTSASAPAWNGIWARVLQAHPGIGFAAPVLYRSASSLVDITLGTNGLYAATPGYDLSTGLGSADISKLVANAG
jgi:pseudomonalisin/xanthomonalisin